MKKSISLTFALVASLCQLSKGDIRCIWCDNLNYNPNDCPQKTCLDSQKCCIGRVGCCDHLPADSTTAGPSGADRSGPSEKEPDTLTHIIIIVCVLGGALLIALSFVLLFKCSKKFNRLVRSIPYKLTGSERRDDKFNESSTSSSFAFKSQATNANLFQQSSSTLKVNHPPPNILDWIQSSE